jgi:hypothetical protein
MSSQMQSHRSSEQGRIAEMSKDDKRRGAGSRLPRGTAATPPRGDELIARNLRMVYDEIAAEPLPPDLAALLMRLDDQGEKPS